MRSKETFAKRLRDLRQSKNLTQKDLAEALGISKSSVVSYENGLRVPTLDALVKIENYFHVTGSYLLGETSDCQAPDSYFLDNNGQMLIKNFRMSSSEVIRVYSNAIEKLCKPLQVDDFRFQRVAGELMEAFLTGAIDFLDTCKEENPVDSHVVTACRGRVLVKVSDAMQSAQQELLTIPDDTSMTQD